MLIAFSGLKGSGKDTAAEVLINEFGYTRIAFADAVRQMALIIDPRIPSHVNNHWYTLSEEVREHGWDTLKRANLEVRRLLQVIGTEAGRMLVGEDIWIDILAKRYPDISNPEARYVITDCRFDNEVAFIKSNNGIVTWIDRPGLTSDGHASESTHIKTLADYIISNDTDIENLQKDVRFLMAIKWVDPIERK